MADSIEQVNAAIKRLHTERDQETDPVKRDALSDDIWAIADHYADYSWLDDTDD